VSDQEALITCIDTWRSQATDLTSTYDLLQILQSSGLSDIASEIKAKQQNNTSSDNMQSLANWSLLEKIGTTAADIFLPILANLLTIAFLVLLYKNKHFNQFGLILLLHWFPVALLFSIHLYFNHRFFGSSLSITPTAMAFLILLQPVSSTILHIQYLLKRASYSAGQAIESYKIRQILQLAEASVRMNNFTSLLVVVITLHLANIGIISMTKPAILVVSASTATLHLFKLVINMMVNYIKEEESFRNIIATIYPILGSLTLKTVSLVVLFSSSTTFSPLYGCLAFLLALAANWQLEKKLVFSDNTEVEVKTLWIRAVESLIFPLPPEPGSRGTSIFGVTLQLLLGDITAATLGFTMALAVGVPEGLFLTQNMVKAFTVTGGGLILYNVVALTLSQKGSALQTESDSEQSDEEALELYHCLGNSNGQEPQRHTVPKGKVVSVLILTIALLLLLASPFPLLLIMFNTCPTFPSLPDSTISCSSPLTVGSQCRLSCSPMFWSSSTPQSQCTWRGAWTEEDLTCRQQAAVIVGMGSKPDSVDWEAVAEVYPAPGKSSFLPGLPKDYTGGSAGYADGRLMYCGGMDDGDPASLPVSSCFSLAPSLLAWEETWPLLQVTTLPSSDKKQNKRVIY
jgi:hypothetical protein